MLNIGNHFDKCVAELTGPSSCHVFAKILNWFWFEHNTHSIRQKPQIGYFEIFEVSIGFLHNFNNFSIYTSKVHRCTAYFICFIQGKIGNKISEIFKFDWKLWSEKEKKKRIEKKEEKNKNLKILV